MNTPPLYLLRAPLLVLFGLALAIGNFFLFRRYAGLRREQAFLFCFGTCVLASVLVGFALRDAPHWRPSARDVLLVSAVAKGLCVLCAAPFVVRLYRKWLQGALTDAESAPGAPGFRAWLSPANLAVALLVSVSAYFGFDLPLPAGLLLTCGALAVWPLLNVAASSREDDARVEDLSSEREKVLAMLESGKITAEESAELLNALGSSVRHEAPPTTPLTPARRLTLLGAALLTLGFFLPWLVIDGADQMAATVVDAIGAPAPAVDLVNTFPANMRWQIAGGGIPHGKGWAVLLLGLAAAAMPYFHRTLDLATQRNLRFLALGIGAFVVLHLMTANPRYVGIGLVIAAAGYLLEFIGALREQRA